MYARWHERDAGRRRHGRVYNPLKHDSIVDLEPGDEPTNPAARRKPRGYYGINDESLAVAAPDARVRVDAPVLRATDSRGQQSQYAIDEYGRNAGDDVAKPDLSTDSQIWAPGVGSQDKKANATAALRYVTAYIMPACRAPTNGHWSPRSSKCRAVRLPTVRSCWKPSLRPT